MNFFEWGFLGRAFGKGSFSKKYWKRGFAFPKVILLNFFDQSNAFGKGKFMKSKVKRRFRRKLKNFLFQKCVSKTEKKRFLGRTFGKGKFY